MRSFLKRLNVFGECRASRLGLWSCPPFLFIVMGVVNIAAMISTYALASNRFLEDPGGPQEAALIVAAVSVGIFVIGNFIIHGFNQIAEANRMKSEFIAIVSHQLRSPLAVFKWTLDAIARGSGPSRMPQAGGTIRPPAPASPEFQRGLADASRGGRGKSDTASYLEMLRENNEKMIQLVNILLEVSRIDAGRLMLLAEPVRLDVLTEEIVHSYRAYAQAANVTLEYALPAGLPPVRGDGERIRMVIGNLADNAIRYSPGGGRVAIALMPISAEFLEWKISDSGVGIPADQQRFIFQKFFRAASGMAHQPHGTGLGLYLARALIAAMGGTIGFTSQEGKGSTFWFRLPVYR